MDYSPLSSAHITCSSLFCLFYEISELLVSGVVKLMGESSRVFEGNATTAHKGQIINSNLNKTKLVACLNNTKQIKMHVCGKLRKDKGLPGRWKSPLKGILLILRSLA